MVGTARSIVEWKPTGTQGLSEDGNGKWPNKRLPFVRTAHWATNLGLPNQKWPIGRRCRTSSLAFYPVVPVRRFRRQNPLEFQCDELDEQWERGPRVKSAKAGKKPPGCLLSVAKAADCF